VTEQTREELRLLEGVEPEEQRVLLAFLAGRAVELDGAERNAALRRSELLLVAGGDPRRPLDVESRAVRALADDLDTPDRRRALSESLDALASELAGLAATAHSAELLRADPGLAWRYFAAALLAEELGSDDARDL
jgi:hypothetical protein